MASRSPPVGCIIAVVSCVPYAGYPCLNLGCGQIRQFGTSHNGTSLYIVNEMGFLASFSMLYGLQQGEWGFARGGYRVLACHPGMKAIVCATDQEILLSVRSANSNSRLACPGIDQIRFAPDGSFLVTRTIQGQLRALSIQDAGESCLHEEGSLMDVPTRSVYFHPKRRILVSASGSWTSFDASVSSVNTPAVDGTNRSSFPGPRFVQAALALPDRGTSGNDDDDRPALHLLSWPDGDLMADTDGRGWEPPPSHANRSVRGSTNHFFDSVLVSGTGRRSIASQSSRRTVVLPELPSPSATLLGCKMSRDHAFVFGKGGPDHLVLCLFRLSTDSGAAEEEGQKLEWNRIPFIGGVLGFQVHCWVGSEMSLPWAVARGFRTAPGSCPPASTGRPSAHAPPPPPSSTHRWPSMRAAL